MNVFQAYGVNYSFTAENQDLWGLMWGLKLLQYDKSL